MNAFEFQKWWHDFRLSFPQTRRWVSENGGETLLERWRASFGGINLADAQEATRLMSTGECDKPRAYEREDTPAFVRAACSRVSYRRGQNEDRERREREGFTRSRAEFPAAMLMIEMRRGVLPKDKTFELGQGRRKKTYHGLGLSKAEASARVKQMLDEYCDKQQGAM